MYLNEYKTAIKNQQFVYHVKSNQLYSGIAFDYKVIDKGFCVLCSVISEDPNGCIMDLEFISDNAKEAWHKWYRFMEVRESLASGVFAYWAKEFSND